MKSALHHFSYASVTVVLVLLGSIAHAQTSSAPALTQSAAPLPTAAAANPATNPVVARGPSGLQVTANDVASELSRMPEESRRVIATKVDTLQQIANNLLVRRVLAHEAEVNKLAQSTAMVAALGIARDRILSDARLAQMDVQNAPSDATVQTYARQIYSANSEKYERPAQTRARHILIANSGPESIIKANALLSQLRGGASFEELAKANSTDTGSGARGGDLGFFAAGQMVRPFEDALAKLVKPGELSEPVESQFGIHIIKLEERREKGRQSFEQVQQQLMAEAKTAILNDARLQKVGAINKDIQIDEAAIQSFAGSSGR